MQSLAPAPSVQYRNYPGKGIHQAITLSWWGQSIWYDLRTWNNNNWPTSSHQGKEQQQGGHLGWFVPMQSLAPAPSAQYSNYPGKGIHQPITLSWWGQSISYDMSTWNNNNWPKSSHQGKGPRQGGHLGWFAPMQNLAPAPSVQYSTYPGKGIHQPITRQDPIGSIDTLCGNLRREHRLE